MSREALVVRGNACVVVEQVHSSRALFGPKAKIISDLRELAGECQEADWDGYGAEPVQALALDLAQEIIYSLPDGVALPECSIEPDGCVSLDWTPARSRTFTLSAGTSSRIPYAWIEGTDRGHAVGRFQDGALSSRILSEIRRFSRHDPSVRAA